MSPLDMTGLISPLECSHIVSLDRYADMVKEFIPVKILEDCYKNGLFMYRNSRILL